MIQLVTVALLSIGLLLLAQARRLRTSTGLGWRPVVYQDTQRRDVTRPLFSAHYRLTGQPDYIVQHGAAWVPVEVKPTRRDRQPRQGDILQLAAYCLLVEESTGHAPPFGLLRYANASFEIPWDDALYAALLAVLEAMQADRHAADVPRSHAEPWRCGACGFADGCEDALEPDYDR